MSQDKIDILQRALNREKAARKQAERILEDKSRELYFLTQQLKETNEKLQENVSEKTIELEKRNKELQDYAHIVSHDLKSPLRNVHALISWVKEDNKGKLDNLSLQNFNHIETALESMDQLISDILNYSSIGTQTIKNIPININDLVINLIEMLYIPKHIKVTILNELPILNGDETKLKQLFQNIISNAVKFIDKPKGKVEIDVVEQTNFYQFSIKDNGVGIKKEFHDKIFDVFYVLNKNKNSTGIGLSVVKKIVELHKGQIWLDSKLGKSTTFYFTLKK